jgi:hypothetical protein
MVSWPSKDYQSSEANIAATGKNPVAESTRRPDGCQAPSVALLADFARIRIRLSSGR